jgi:hypothetical protein
MDHAGVLLSGLAEVTARGYEPMCDDGSTHVQARGAHEQRSSKSTRASPGTENGCLLLSQRV